MLNIFIQTELRNASAIITPTSVWFNAFSLFLWHVQQEHAKCCNVHLHHLTLLGSAAGFTTLFGKECDAPKAGFHTLTI